MTILDDICKEIERIIGDAKCGTALVISEKAYDELAHDCLVHDKEMILALNGVDVIVGETGIDGKDWIVENWEWT